MYYLPPTRHVVEYQCLCRIPTLSHYQLNHRSNFTATTSQHLTRQRAKRRHPKLKTSRQPLQDVKKPEELHGYEVRVVSPVRFLRERTEGIVERGGVLRSKHAPLCSFRPGSSHPYRGVLERTTAAIQPSGAHCINLRMVLRRG